MTPKELRNHKQLLQNSRPSLPIQLAKRIRGNKANVSKKVRGGNSSLRKPKSVRLRNAAQARLKGNKIDQNEGNNKRYSKRIDGNGS